MRTAKLLFPILFSMVVALSAPVFAALDTGGAPSTKTLEIIKITPEGDDVPAAKQIVVQFNRPVVPIGKMERASSEIPIIIAPALSCEWRWINTSALACNLSDKEPLQSSTHYTVEVKPGIKAEDGTTIEKAYEHSFITERADIRYKEFQQWKSPSLPVVRLVFNQPVDQQSVAEHVYMDVGEPAKRVAVLVSSDPDDHDQPTFMPIPGEKGALVFKKTAPQKSDDDLHKSGGREARRIWLVQPANELGLDQHIVVKLEAGLVSALGPEKSIATNDIVQLDTYPEFKFLGIRCTNNAGEILVFEPGQSTNGKCNPMQTVNLSFSAPVERDKMGKMLAFNPPVGGWRRSADEDTENEGDGATQAPAIGYQFRQPHTKDKTYDIWLPPGLKAAQEYTVKTRVETLNFFQRIGHWVMSLFGRSDVMDVKDIFGRPLKSSVASSFVTDHRNPNYVLDYSDAVLEKGVDSEVPLYINNITNYLMSYRRLSNAGSEADLKFNKDTPEVKDIQFAIPLGVRDMLKGKSGAIFGYLTTTPSLGGTPPRLFAEVTPFQVHFKFGHFASLAWVTSLATGEPIVGAKLSLYQDAFTTLQEPKTPTTKGVTDASGVALLPGTDTLDPELKLSDTYQDEDKRFFIKVEKDDEMALLPISPRFAINNYRSSGSEDIWPSNKQRYGHMRAWGTTAQGIYRAGDTIQYKVFLRNQDNDRFIPAPSKSYHLSVIDPMGKIVHDVKNITLSAFGGTEGSFTVPKEGAVGWYKFKLRASFIPGSEDSEDTANEGEDGQNEAQDTDDGKSWTPMRVLVSDFTPAAFKVSNQLNGDLFHSDDKVEVTTHAELHSGGVYTDASARITAILDSSPFISKNPVAKAFQFDSYENEATTQQLFQKIDKVGDKGELSLGFSAGKPKIVYGKLMVESAVADDRGKYVSGQAHADYIGVDRLVGLKSTEWVYSVGKPANIQYIAVDEKGNPIKGTKVDVAVEYKVTKAARVKGAGNAYLTEYHTEWEKAGTCNGTSTDDALTCTFTPTKSGGYRITAKIKDTKGNDHSTALQTYATGNDYVVWDDESDSSLTIVPQSTDYKVGDTARYLVKNPYPGAQALVTIERYGVIEHFVQKLEGSTPIIEFKIKPDYLPGFYLSVVVMSPRVEKPLGEGQVDLGKPTFRMGYITVPVKDPYKEMVITAKTDKDVYKPRDKVTLTLHAEPRTKDTKEPIELTVAVLDESVFDLIAGGKSYFDPYEGFYKLESLDLRNYSLLTRLVGRQKFEKKGANPGGDGGNDLSMRSLFKFISYWNGQLATDKDGNATVSFEAPDNLTGWRVLAIATTPSDRFGLGDGNFKVNRPTEIRPVMPNQLMEGDTFNAGFSVMNRTDKERTIDVRIHVDGAVNNDKPLEDLTKKIVLGPYKRTTVFMPVQASILPQFRDKPVGNMLFSVNAGDATDSDGIVHEVHVNKRRSLDVAANYGTTTQDMAEEHIDFPKDILTDTGSVSVVASPTVIGNISGAFGYMRDYPYLCWEQKLSKAVMASHYKNLKAYLPATLKWDESDSLTQATLDQAASFQTPSGGMAYFVAQDEYADPYLSAYTALAFNWMRKSGYKVPEQVENKLQTYLSNLLKNNAVPDFYSEGMTSTVRAVALAALAERGKADLADLQRYQPHAKKMSLFGKSYFLQAAMAIKGGMKYAPDIAKMILAMSNETGGKYVFSETLDDSYTRILASPLRENCAVLDAFVAFGERKDGADLVGDVPFKLVRTITQDRKNRDHWENTQENMFCMNALIDFARVYEKDAPQFTVKASLDEEAIGQAAFKDVRDPAATLDRPIKAGDAGRKATLKIERTGTGRLYYQARLSYALPFEMSKPANAGIEIHREYSVERNGKWELLKTPATVKRGELVRVDLYVSVPAARNFVVVDDAVPGGLEPVNRDLATTSEVDAKKADFQASGGSFWFKYSDWIDFAVSRWSFYHQEIRHDSVRFYSDYLDAGNYHLSYAAQAIATGTFSALPTMAAEMYDPDVYGKTEGLSLNVSEQEDLKP